MCAHKITSIGLNMKLIRPWNKHTFIHTEKQSRSNINALKNILILKTLIGSIFIELLLLVVRSHARLFAIFFSHFCITPFKSNFTPYIYLCKAFVAWIILPYFGKEQKCERRASKNWHFLTMERVNSIFRYSRSSVEYKILKLVYFGSASHDQHKFSYRVDFRLNKKSYFGLSYSVISYV